MGETTEVEATGGMRAPSFDTAPYMKVLGGKKYLPVAPRIAWLREVYPEARIETEIHTLDLDAKLCIAHARITIPSTGASAEDYGSETERDFKDYIEKAITKSVGRALASLGFGTLMAQELDEGERIVDSPQPARAHPAARPTPPAATSQDKQGGGTALIAGEVEGLLATDKDAAGKLPKPVADMTEEELTKTLAWLRNRATGRRQQA